MTDEEKTYARLASELAEARRQRAELERQMRESQAQLEAAGQGLEGFCHAIAHDLRAPLQIILGYANLLSTDFVEEMSPEVHTHLQNIETYAQRMGDMITNLLAFTKLRGTAEEAMRVDVGPIIEAALHRSQHRLDSPPVAVSVAPDLPPVLGYDAWLEEVFVNLINNALNRIGTPTPAARVIISGATQPGGSVRYRVQDSGPPLAEQDQARLSATLSQPYTVQARGLSLELSITHRIVTRLNGAIGIEGTPGQGSTVWFSLPGA
jgi:signal transduction histidine kinase